LTFLLAVSRLKKSALATSGNSICRPDFVLLLRPSPLVLRLAILVEQDEAVLSQFEDRFFDSIPHRSEDHPDLYLRLAADDHTTKLVVRVGGRFGLDGT